MTREKQKNIMLCPVCFKQAEVTKNGVRNNIQRFKCKNCGHTFNDPQKKGGKYERSSKRILSLLLNLLENDFFGKDKLAEALKSTDKYETLACKIQFNSYFADKYRDLREMKIGCYKPKLLICQDERDITFIQIPPFDINNYKKTEKDVWNNPHDRTITIIDNKSLGENNKLHNTHL